MPSESFDPVEVAALSPDALEAAVTAALEAFAAASSLDELKAARTAHVGDRSPLALANREIGALPPAARAAAGQRVGAARGSVNKALAARQTELEAERDSRVLVEETVDVTLPTGRRPVGARHPVNTVQELLTDIFVDMGWGVAEGPEAEGSWFNFDALNTPPEHPSRDLTDTFYVNSPDSGVVLRTQTSPVQIRTMLERQPPIYIVCPGRVYRTDEVDATHSPMFHQLEGLAVDEGLTMAHLKGTLDHMARRLYGAAPALLPLHRAERRDGSRVLRLPRRLRRQPRAAVPDVQERRMDRVGRVRHGRSARAHRLRHRSGPLQRLRIRHGGRPHADVP
jgi:phenylalanyl-tRNA synthetase alpha chain